MNGWASLTQLPVIRLLGWMTLSRRQSFS